MRRFFSRKLKIWAIYCEGAVSPVGSECLAHQFLRRVKRQTLKRKKKRSGGVEGRKRRRRRGGSQMWSFQAVVRTNWSCAGQTHTDTAYTDTHTRNIYPPPPLFFLLFISDFPFVLSNFLNVSTIGTLSC